MKHTPALLRFDAAFSPALAAMALTCDFVRGPRGNMKCCRAVAGTEARKYDWSLLLSSPFSNWGACPVV